MLVPNFSLSRIVAGWLLSSLPNFDFSYPLDVFILCIITLHTCKYTKKSETKLSADLWPLDWVTSKETSLVLEIAAALRHLWATLT